MTKLAEDAAPVIDRAMQIVRSEAPGVENQVWVSYRPKKLAIVLLVPLTVATRDLVHRAFTAEFDQAGWTNSSRISLVSGTIKTISFHHPSRKLT
jgi:hypothetical protein